MADQFKLKRGDVKLFRVTFVREPDDDPVTNYGAIVANEITVRIRSMEEGSAFIINENVDTVITQNPLVIEWSNTESELDVAGGDFGMELEVNPGGSTPERFPVNGFIPVLIEENLENIL